MTIQEFSQLYPEYFAASCVDGLYGIESVRTATAELVETYPEAVVEILEDNLKGWPGEVFANISYPDGQRIVNVMGANE